MANYIWTLQDGRPLFPNGTAASPSVGFAGDPDTGLYSVGADQLGFTMGGVNAHYFSLHQYSLKSDLGTITLGSSADVIIVRDAANTLALRNVGNAQRLNLGQGNTALAAGRLAMGRDAAAAFAPGAGYGMLRWETGTNAGTLKLVAYAGTSTTGVTVSDNVGGGN